MAFSFQMNITYFAIVAAIAMAVEVFTNLSYSRWY
jgi:hypothetical protein